MRRRNVLRFVGIVEHVEEFDLTTVMPSLGVRIDEAGFVLGNAAGGIRRSRGGCDGRKDGCGC